MRHSRDARDLLYYFCHGSWKRFFLSPWTMIRWIQNLFFPQRKNFHLTTMISAYSWETCSSIGRQLTSLADRAIPGTTSPPPPASPAWVVPMKPQFLPFPRCFDHCQKNSLQYISVVCVADIAMQIIWVPVPIHLKIVIVVLDCIVQLITVNFPKIKLVLPCLF